MSPQINQAGEEVEQERETKEDGHSRSLHLSGIIVVNHNRSFCSFVLLLVKKNSNSSLKFEARAKG